MGHKKICRREKSGTEKYMQELSNVSVGSNSWQTGLEDDKEGDSGPGKQQRDMSERLCSLAFLMLMANTGVHFFPVIQIASTRFLFSLSAASL